MKKYLKRIFRIILLILIIAIWIYSLFKIVTFLELDKKIRIWGCSVGDCLPPLPPNPPDPPNPPCPPCGQPTPSQPPPCHPTATPTPASPTPTATPPCRPTATPTPIQTLTLTPTPATEITPTFTPTPTPTSPPSVGGGGDGSPGEPPHCGAQVPGAPTLLEATQFDPHQVNLLWTPVDPSTHYSIVYGLLSGNYTYGVADVGKTTSFRVGGLASGAKYCFAVRAVNDCMPGALSNEICTGKALGGGAVLGASTLGATGSFDDELLQILFIIGCVCLSLGLRLSLPAKRQV